jgi:RND family efflux transporter MFP subunit
MADWANAWLELQCNMISGVTRGIVALGAPDRGPFRPVAFWPASASDASEEFLAILELATSRRQRVSQPTSPAEAAPSSSPLYIANPIILKGQVVGAIAIEIDRPSTIQEQAVIQLLEWGQSWLRLLLEREPTRKPKADNPEVGIILSLIVMAIEHQRFRAAATAIATELAIRFQCERVSFGFKTGKRIQVEALSHNAVFDKRSNLIRAIGLAMDEAMAQADSIVFDSSEQNNSANSAHASLAKNYAGTNICTVPLIAGQKVVGAMTFEREDKQTFSSETLKLFKEIGSLIGPVLLLKRQQELGLTARLQNWFREQNERLFGQGHPIFKAAVVGGLVFVLLISLVKGEYRVAASATLEGSVQRAVVAPINGYIATATARAGDLVKAGDIMGALEDKDLKLEQVKLHGQREQLQKEYRNALAARDRSQIRVLSARITQTDAQLELIQEQLSRTQLTAPIGGVIVKGDLSQSLGSPVEQGLVLFEIAPLDEYRIILHVDERDIMAVKEGQQGQLALTSMAGETLLFSVSRITPVSSQEQGSNTFRVEARLHEPSQHLRPGMEGTGKIIIGQRRLIWIWTHSLVDWLRLALWVW